MGVLDDIVMRLVLKGQDPGEAGRLAGQTYRELEQSLQASMAKQTAAHKAAADAISKEAQKTAKEQIKATLDATKQITQAMQEQERAAKKAAQGVSSSWHRTMEDLENITTVARGAWDLLGGLKNAFDAFSKEVIETTAIFNSTHVSIDAANEALGGTVAKMDLIKAANRATASGLQLTAEQFADVARQANTFANSVGTNGPQAIDQLTQAIASGSPKALKAFGIYVDGDRTFKAFAKTLGVAKDELSDTGQRLAVQAEALAQLRTRAEQAAGGLEKPAIVAERLEQTLAAAKNRWDELLFAIGNTRQDSALVSIFDYLSAKLATFIKDAYHGLVVELPHFIRLAVAQAKDIPAGVIKGITGKDVGERYVDQENARYGAALEAEAKAQMAATKAKAESLYPRTATEELIDRKVKQAKLEYEGIDRLLAAGEQLRNNELSSIRAEVAATEELIRMLDELSDPNSEKFAIREGAAESATKSLKGYSMPTSISAGWSKTATTDADGNRTEAETDKFAAAQSHGVISQQMQAQLTEQYRALGRSLQDVDGHKELDGPGLIERMMFGPTGSPEVLYDKMTEAQKITYDTTKSMSDVFKDFGNAMAGAVGSSMAAAIGENQSFLASLKNTTHQVLMSLSAQALTKGLMELAEGVAALANPYTAWTAPIHFKAAAAFGAVGVAAGIGARLTYSGGASAGAGSTPTASRGTSSSNVSGTGAARSSEPTNVTVNIYGVFATQDDVARGMSKAAVAYKMKTGRPLEGFV